MGSELNRQSLAGGQAPEPGDNVLILRAKVKADAAGHTLLDFLTKRFRYHERDVWLQHIATGIVKLDGKPTTPEVVLYKGQEVSYAKQHREPDVPTDVGIVYDHGGVLVVDKPAGLPVHADGAFLTRTLVGVLATKLGTRPLVVHRLDRETSGLCVLARDRRTARSLHASIADGTFAKTYEAIVRGVMVETHLTIDLAVGRDPTSTIAMRQAAFAAGTQGVAAARTEVEVVARGRDCTLVRCQLLTGRMHQIRVHLAAVGHPIIGDVLYGRSDAEFLAWVQHVKAGGDLGFGREIRRHLLHARAITLVAPTGGPRLEFSAPWPDDCASWLARFGA